MKKIILILICTIAMMACNRKGAGNNHEQNDSNSFSTPKEALDQAIKNLPQLLNDNQRKTFGLDSDEVVRKLTAKKELPITYLNFGQLKDSTIKDSKDAVFYALGDEKESKIGVTIGKKENKWIQSVIGSKKFIRLVQQEPDITRIIEVPGLEVILAEVKRNDTTGYYPIVDYPEARIFRQQMESSSSLLKKLENYRAILEKKYGKDFIDGNLDR